MTKQPAANGLVGRFFHSISHDTKTIKWQGVVLCKVEPDFYLVQFFSWMDGEPTVQRIVCIAEMRDWSFYSTDGEMRDAWRTTLPAEQAASSKRREEMGLC